MFAVLVAYDMQHDDPVHLNHLIIQFIMLTSLQLLRYNSLHKYIIRTVGEFIQERESMRCVAF